MNEFKDSSVQELLKQQSTNKKDPDSAEKALTIIAKVTLWFGILCSFALLIIAGVKEEESLLLIMLCVLLTSITTWALLSVISNISITLKSIDRKIS